MSFISKSINEDEKVFARVNMSLWSQLHWFLLTLAFMISIVWIGVFGAIGLIFLIIAYINLNTYEFAVTDRQILYKKGFFSWETTDLPLSRVETIDINQSILGRFLDYGTVTVCGTGGHMSRVKWISQPFEFRKSAMQALQMSQKSQSEE